MVRECSGPTKGLVQISRKKRITPTDFMTKKFLNIICKFCQWKMQPLKKSPRKTTAPYRENWKWSKIMTHFWAISCVWEKHLHVPSSFCIGPFKVSQIQLHIIPLYPVCVKLFSIKMYLNCHIIGESIYTTFV